MCARVRDNLIKSVIKRWFKFILMFLSLHGRIFNYKNVQRVVLSMDQNLSFYGKVPLTN